MRPARFRWWLAGIALPLLGLLLGAGVLGQRQLESSAELLARRRADALFDRGRRALTAWSDTLEAGLRATWGTLAEEDVATGRTPAPVVLLRAGRLLAPRLPAEEEEPPPALADLLVRARTLAVAGNDPEAAAALLREALRLRPPDAGEARLLAELAALSARLGDHPAVLACAERLAGLPTPGRRSFLLVGLLRLAALAALDQPVAAERARLARAVRVEQALGTLPGAGFYLEQLGPDSSGVAEAGLCRRLAGLFPQLPERAPEGPLEEAPARLHWQPGALLCRLPLAGASAAFALPPRTLADSLRTRLPQEVAWELCAPGGEAVLGAVEGPHRTLPLRGLLEGWSLRLAALPDAGAARALARQRWLLAGVLGLAGLVLLGSLLAGAAAARRALALARTRADFLAGVTHDLKTPLSLIQLYAETLHAGRVSEQAQREAFLGIILGETQRLHGLIENVLRLTRRPGPRREETPTALAATVRATLDGYTLPPERTLRVDIDAALRPLPHDPPAIASLLGNLLSNALKFSEGAVEVSLREEDDAVVLEVADRGVGIPAPERARVCEPFFRGSAAPHIRGSGLGLSVVARIVEAHRAALTIEPREGGGTRVRVRFS